MKSRYLYIILILLSFPAYPGIAQNDCEVPSPPVLNSVSILPETSSVLLNWTLSESTGIAAYIVYIYETRDGNTEFFSIDTLWNPMATSFSDTRTQYKSFQYRVASFRQPKCASELSNILSTIFAETLIDTCEKKINISWNRYTPPAPQIVTKYTILMSLNGSSFSEIGSVSPETTSFILSDFMIDGEYCFRVDANINEGANSSSYKACLTAKMEKPPAWINADYATPNPTGSIDLSFTIDPGSEIDLFALERRDGYSGSFRQITRIQGTDPEKVTYTDKTARQDAVYFYRLSAVNNCNIKSVTSNIASNIVLNSLTAGNEIILRWNKYHEWLGTVSSYRIYTDKGNGFVETDVVPPNDTILRVSIPEIMYSLTSGKVCFYVAASESGNIHGITGESKSNEVCTIIEDVITVPDIFSPDGDGINDLFKPVITFAPSGYQLSITDRQRKTIFETRDYNESWNGTAGGNPVPQGVYLWFLKLTTPSGRIITRTGTVTVIKTI